jgi:hypothetical protein
MSIPNEGVGKATHLGRKERPGNETTPLVLLSHGEGRASVIIKDSEAKPPATTLV